MEFLDAGKSLRNTQRPMRILYLHQYYHTPAEGGGVRSYHVASALAAAGHQVHVVTTCGGPARLVTRHGNLLVTALPIPYSNQMRPAQRVRAFLRFVWDSYRISKAWLPADRVFATSTPLTIGLAALLLKMFHGVPYVFEVRDPWPEAPIQLGFVKHGLYKEFLRRLERGIYSSAHRLIALSPYMQEHVQARAGNREVQLIPNFADTAFYDTQAPRMAFASEPQALYRRSFFHVVYTGSFGYANQTGRLLDLALAARQANLPIRFTLAGSGAEFGQAQAFISDHGLEACVALLPHQSNYAVRDLLATADAAYVGFRPEPVLQGNSPNKFFDALAASVPVLLAMKGWLAEEVRATGCGVVLGDYGTDIEGLKAIMAADPLNMRTAAACLATRFDKEVLVNDLVQTIVT